MIIVLGFDGIENLDLLWKANTEDSEMTKLLQDVVITPTILKDLEINHAIIKSKIYKDEYLECKEELLARTLDRLNIANTGRRHIDTTISVRPLTFWASKVWKIVRTIYFQISKAPLRKLEYWPDGLLGNEPSPVTIHQNHTIV